MATNISSVLKDVVAYVDVWSSDKTANYSKPFVQQLQEMGAQVTKAFTKQVTHVIFSHGHPATWRKAKKNNVKLVSVLWISRCYEEAVQVNEDLFPALNETNPVLKNKKHRCMQPKDSPERTPDNDKRMRRKLDKMMKDLTPMEPLVTDVSPIIIDEKNGIIYSPAFKRSDYMARRLKDMKEKHENISLTASQMVESPTALKPALGDSPTLFKHSYDQSDNNSSPSVAETGSAAESPAKEEGTSLPNIKDHQRERLRIETTEQPWMSPCRQMLAKIHVSPVRCPEFEENEDEKEYRRKSSRRASRISMKRNNTESVKSILTDTPGTSDSKKSGKKVSRRSTIKSPSSASKELKTLSSESRSKKGQELTKGDKKTETKSPKNVKYNASTTTDAATSLSIKPTSPREPSESKLTPILSALVRPPTLPCESRKTVSCSTDGDDVFEDYFSPANLRQKRKKALSSGLSAKTFQLPFELDSDSKKRKQRQSESAVNETSASKKKKLELSTLHFKGIDMVDASESLSHKDGNKLLSDLDSDSGNLKQMTKKKRQSVLPFTTVCAPPTTRHKRLSLFTETTKSEEPGTALELHKKTDRSLKSSVTSKGNEDTVTSGLTQTASEEQTERKGTSLQTMVHSTKVGRTLVMTSMPTEKQGTVVQVVKALGGFTLVDEVCSSTTHVVSGSHRRTLNILLGIARGCWILSFEWILWSLEKRQWIPEEPYELSDQFPAAQMCRLQRHLSAGEHQQDLFQDQPAMFVSHLSQPPPQSLVELIQLCGGTVCRTVRQAGLLIGRYGGRRPEGSRVLSEQWVLDSITHLKLLPYDDYTLD